MAQYSKQVGDIIVFILERQPSDKDVREVIDLLLLTLREGRGTTAVRTERTATIARTYRRGGVTVQLRPRGTGLYAYALYREAPQGKRRQAGKQVRRYLGRVTLVLQEGLTP